MVVSDCSKIDPALLPTSPRALFYHGLRVYHQIAVWKDLNDADKDPLRWVWKLLSYKYVLIMTDAEAGSRKCSKSYGVNVMVLVVQKALVEKQV